MFFVLDYNGRKIVLMASSVSELNQLCCDHVKSEVAAIWNGNYVTESQFTSPPSGGFLAISAAPISEGRSETPAAELKSVHHEPPVQASTNVAEQIQVAVTTPPPADLPSRQPTAPTSTTASQQNRGFLEACTASNGVQRLLDLRKAKAKQEAAAADMLAAERKLRDIDVPAARPSRVPAPAPVADSSYDAMKSSSPAPVAEFSSDVMKSTAPAQQPKPLRTNHLEAITMEDVVRFSSFVDLRLETLSRISNEGLVFGNNNYLHFIRCDTKELIVTAQDYEALRSCVLKRQKNPGWNWLEVAATWRLDGKPLEAREPTRESNCTQLQPQCSTSPHAQKEPHREVLPIVAEVSPSTAMWRGQVKLCVQGAGVVGYIPFDRHFPPSFWLLLQHVSHLTSIPQHLVEINVVCDHIKEVLVVQSDFDVRAVSHMMGTSEPTLFAVDLRL